MNLDGTLMGDRRSDSPRKYDYGFDLDPYSFDFDDDSTILTSSLSPPPLLFQSAVLSVVPQLELLRPSVRPSVSRSEAFAV